MHAALEEFPEDEWFMYDLFQALDFIEDDMHVEECIKVGEKIIALNFKEIPQFSVKQKLSFSYKRKGDLEAAEKYANMLPDAYCTRSSVLEFIKRGKELQKITQQNIIFYIGLIYQSVNSMLASKNYTTHERILAFESLIKLYDLFICDENYQNHTNSVMSLWKNLAKEYAKRKDVSNTIEALKKAFELAKKADNLTDSKGTSLFTDTIEFKANRMIRNYEYENMDIIRMLLSQPDFDFVRELA